MPPEFTLDPAAEAAADEIAEQMPEPQQHAIDQHAAKTVEENAVAESSADIDGVMFDAKIHTGSKLKSGQWRKRKTPGNSVVGKSRKQTAAPAETVDATKAAQDAQSRAAGAMAAGSIFMLGRAFGGDEWIPTDEEVAMQTDAWGNYFIAKGVNDFPPGVALVIAVGAYAGPRFSQPKTQKRVAGIRDWFALRVAKWKLKKYLRSRGSKSVVTIQNGELCIDGTRANSWNDGERKDNTGAEPSGQSEAARVRNPRT